MWKLLPSADNHFKWFETLDPDQTRQNVGPNLDPDWSFSIGLDKQDF